MKNWYLLKTKPKQETIAAEQLANQNYHIFLPKAIIKNKTQVLFPGYIFIELDDKVQNWTPIRSTKGVLNFVRFGLKFAKVPNSIINTIKIQQQRTIEKMIDICSHQQGDLVEIQSGAFKGQKAIFQNYSASDRVVILLSILGQESIFEVNEQQVVAI